MMRNNDNYYNLEYWGIKISRMLNNFKDECIVLDKNGSPDGFCEWVHGKEQQTFVEGSKIIYEE